MAAGEAVVRGKNCAWQAIAPSTLTGVQHPRSDTPCAFANAPRQTKSTGTTYALHVLVAQHVADDNMRTYNICARESRPSY